MKTFYAGTAMFPHDSAAGVQNPDGPLWSSALPDRSSPYIGARARIAVYEVLPAAPRVVDVNPAPTIEFIEILAARVFELSHAEGGAIPYTVIREIAENFIHADFAEPVVSILDHGSTIRFADQGPGILDKERVLLPGFTTARGDMKRFIRGVGSGLPIVRDFLMQSGGTLSIEDNLGVGSVVTIHETRTGEKGSVPLSAPPQLPPTAQLVFEVQDGDDDDKTSPAAPRLTARQKRVLALVLESGLAGPSLVSKQLGIGVATAYRDLSWLEERGLIVSDGGKRTLTPDGLSYLGDLTNHS